MGPMVGLDEREISPPPGFDPRTVQHVASRYTDYATRPTCTLELKFNIHGTVHRSMTSSNNQRDAA